MLVSHDFTSLLTGRRHGVARDESRMGCNLVYYQGTLERTILREINNTNNRKNTVCKRSDSKKLGSKSYLHL